MFSKIAIFALLVAVAHSSAIHGDYTSFSYGVSDPHTGDVKSQSETRSGGNVVGQYSLLESDGTRRTVDYAANDHTGFNAIVRKDPALISYAAPVIAAPIAHAAPIAYAAPVAHAASIAYSAPIVHGAGLAYGAHAAPLAYSAYSAPLAHGAIAYGAHGYGAHGLGARLGW
ncbi:larval/pupal rigid cuticle protein 66-like [Epargyreus clarus]|uniref:larval/pupal rigid cuticle protein 66-like n=1 Tax=Epargyreus clarus TaxID=520877 RepID=UPI003C2FF162